MQLVMVSFSLARLKDLLDPSLLLLFNLEEKLEEVDVSVTGRWELLEVVGACKLKGVRL